MNDIETVRHAIAQHTIIYRDDALAAFERIVAAQAQAVKDENEACAKICDDGEAFSYRWGSRPQKTPTELAAAIRARQNGSE